MTAWSRCSSSLRAAKANSISAGFRTLNTSSQMASSSRSVRTLKQLLVASPSRRLHGDVALMVFWQVNTPVGHGHRPHILAHLAVGGDGLGVLVAAKDVVPAY